MSYEISNDAIKSSRIISSQLLQCCLCIWIKFLQTLCEALVIHSLSVDQHSVILIWLVDLHLVLINFSSGIIICSQRSSGVIIFSQRYSDIINLSQRLSGVTIYFQRSYGTRGCSQRFSGSNLTCFCILAITSLFLRFSGLCCLFNLILTSHLNVCFITIVV